MVVRIMSDFSNVNTFLEYMNVLNINMVELYTYKYNLDLCICIII